LIKLILFYLQIPYFIVLAVLAQTNSKYNEPQSQHTA